MSGLMVKSAVVALFALLVNSLFAADLNITNTSGIEIPIIVSNSCKIDPVLVDHVVPKHGAISIGYKPKPIDSKFKSDCGMYTQNANVFMGFQYGNPNKHNVISFSVIWEPHTGSVIMHSEPVCGEVTVKLGKNSIRIKKNH